MYKLNDNDVFIIYKCKNLITKLIEHFQKNGTDKDGIVGLSKALYALSNYPGVVIRGAIHITSLVQCENKESNYCSITISDDNFQLASGGTVYNEGVGSDSFSNIFYEYGVSTDHDIESEIFDWIDMFNNYMQGGKLTIEDEAEFFDGEEMEEEDE